MCISNRIMKQKHYSCYIMHHGTLPYAEQVLNRCLFKAITRASATVRCVLVIAHGNFRL